MKKGDLEWNETEEKQFLKNNKYYIQTMKEINESDVKKLCSIYARNYSKIIKSKKINRPRYNTLLLLEERIKDKIFWLQMAKNGWSFDFNKLEWYQMKTSSGNENID